MIETLKKELSQEEMSSFHSALLRECKALVGMSRSKMKDHYSRWDRNEAVYKGELNLSKEDLKAIQRDEPVRVIHPLTMSQVNTFVAIVYSLYTQRPAFYELEGTGPEDHNPAKIVESLLDRDLDWNNFKGSVLPQFIRSVAKRGLGVVKYYWHEDCTYEEEEVVEPPSLMDRVMSGFGVSRPPKVTLEMVKFTQFMGNRVENQDPYRFFPDPRVPLSRFQDGEFCGSEDEYSYAYLRRGEAEGRYAGVKFVKDMNIEGRDDPYVNRRISFRRQLDSISQTGHSIGGGDRPKLPIVVTQLIMDIVPSEYELSDGEMLGKEDYPVKYLIEYANDQRIINVERLPYRRFPYEVGQFLEDESDYVGLGLSDTLEHLQDLISWLLNTRVANIKKVIGTRLIVDPIALDIDDLENRSPIIKMTPSATGRDISTFIYQLQLQDVTTNNVQDIGILQAIAKETTGISENLIGQFSSGRRSAQEAANVNQNALARIKIHADSLWDTALKPMGQGMIYNHRRLIQEGTLLKVRGLHNFDHTTGQYSPAAQSLLTITKAELEGSYDIKVFEGSTPSERNFRASQVFEMLKMALQNPEGFLQIFQLNPHELAMEWLYLSGSDNLTALKLTTPQLQQFLKPFLAEKAIEYHVQNRSNQPAYQQSSMEGGGQVSSEGEGIDNIFSALTESISGGGEGSVL